MMNYRALRVFYTQQAEAPHLKYLDVYFHSETITIASFNTGNQQLKYDKKVLDDVSLKKEVIKFWKEYRNE